jgi:hypothetical protein
MLLMSEEAALTRAQRVWIRASKRNDVALKDGDRALKALLILHGRIMNGGVYHGVLAASDKLEAGLRGYDYFALDELSAIVKQYRDSVGTSDAAANSAYYKLKPDRMIQEHFERKLMDTPDQFAPVEDD